MIYSILRLKRKDWWFSSHSVLFADSGCRPFVADYGPEWLIGNVISLVAGSMILTQVGEAMSELKLGNGTSILIFANIASALPTSVGGAFSQATGDNGSLNLAIYFLAFAITTLGIVFVQVCAPVLPFPKLNIYFWKF